jgi:molybdenum cofactor cytidylyltransferase
MESGGCLGVIVLAAGDARRLGGDKAALPWGRGTLLQHVVRQFSGAYVGRRVVVLSARNEAGGRRGLPRGVEVVVNRDCGSEMVVSARVGLAGLGEWQGPVCIHPVDVFAVSRELVRVLYEGWRRQPECVHVPEVAGKGAHPLLVPPALTGEILAIPPGCGLNWLLREHAGEVVRHPWEDELLLADIDTGEDYRRYRPG